MFERNTVENEKKKKALNKYYFSIIVHNRMKQKITFG